MATDVSLKAFQFKIIHRILATNRLLFKMKISNYDLCTFCTSASESISHLFWDCTIIKNLWFRVFEELKIREIFPLVVVNEKLIMFFGYKEDTVENTKLLNILIVMIKYFIYKASLDGKDQIWKALNDKLYIGVRFLRVLMNL